MAERRIIAFKANRENLKLIPTFWRSKADGPTFKYKGWSIRFLWWRLDVIHSHWIKEFRKSHKNDE